jgi:hypothetical protein
MLGRIRELFPFIESRRYISGRLNSTHKNMMIV